MKKFRALSALASLAVVALGGTAAVAAPAPQLTSLSILNIASADKSENITANQTSTVQQYGGQPVDITVREIGSSSQRFAYINNSTAGISVTAIRQLCGSASAPTTCTPGQIAIGNDYTWHVSGSSLGQFKAWYTGPRAPYVNLYVYLTIQ